MNQSSKWAEKLLKFSLTVNAIDGYWYKANKWIEKYTKLKKNISFEANQLAFLTKVNKYLLICLKFFHDPKN